MEKALGRIENLDLDTRTFLLKIGHQKKTFLLSKAQIKKYNIYLRDGLYAEFEYLNEATIINNVKCYPVMGFIKLCQNINRVHHIYFNINKIKKEISQILNKPQFKMFIDLEFSMPPYERKTPFTSEIIQYGIVILDQNDIVVFEDSSLIEPLDKTGISNRLNNFMHVNIKDFVGAMKPIEFYEVLGKVLAEYHPSIYVWGTNDILMLDRFYKLHQLEPLTSRASFINLMQIIKNYYGLKNDIGLFNALNLFDDTFDEEQMHDALDDAMVTSMVYHHFRMYTNEIK